LTPEGDTSHTMRYLAPDGPNNVEVYLQTPDGWQKAETTVDGSYLKFTAPCRYHRIGSVPPARQ